MNESDSRREDQWFRENEKQMLEAARVAREKRGAERASLEQQAAREALKQQHFMKCPKCGHDMVEQDLQGVLVDRCTFLRGRLLRRARVGDHLPEEGRGPQGDLPPAGRDLARRPYPCRT